jgi:hypothetical protein
MKTLVVSAMALTAMGSVALADEPRPPAAEPVVLAAAEPVVLTEAQLDEVTAGQSTYVNVLNVGVAGVCVLAGPCDGRANIFNQNQ